MLEIPREIDQYIAKGIKLCGPVSHSDYKVNDRLRNQCPTLAKWLMAADKYECDIQTTDPSKDPDDDGFVPNAILRIRLLLWRNKKAEPRIWVLYPPPSTTQLKSFGSCDALEALWTDFGEIRIPEAFASEPIESIAPFYVNSGSNAASRSEIYRLLEEDAIAEGDPLTPFPFDRSLIVATCARRALVMADKDSGALSCLSVSEPGIWHHEFGIRTSDTDNFHVQTPSERMLCHQFIEHIACRQIRWIEEH